MKASFFVLQLYYFLSLRLSCDGYHPLVKWVSKSSLSRLSTRASLREGQPLSEPHSCRFCGSEHASRNALFEHLRTSKSCMESALAEAKDPMLVAESLQAKAQKRTIALLVGYDGSFGYSAEEMEETLRIAFKEHTGYLPSTVTRATATRHRHVAMAQEKACAAAGDVLIVGIQQQGNESTGDLIQGLNAWVQRNCDIAYVGTSRKQDEATKNVRRSAIIPLRVLAATKLPSSSRLHAEASCTQLAYHYLLPLRWLPEGVEAHQWLATSQTRSQSPPASSYSSLSSTPPPLPSARSTTTALRKPRFGVTSGQHRDRRWVGPPPAALKKLKKALKAACAATSAKPAEKVEKPAQTVRLQKSKGRFGALAGKERRCFHNFADPLLKGDASPSNAPVWRSLDRARAVEFVQIGEIGEGGSNGSLGRGGESHAVIELRGDGFLAQQVRRIVGSAVAMAHGWLPDDFFDVATRPDVVVETPLAPAGRVYLAGARYDFTEARDGRALFDLTPSLAQDQTVARPSDTNSMAVWLRELRRRLVLRRDDSQALVRTDEEADWLIELRDVVAPRIREQLRLIRQADDAIAQAADAAAAATAALVDEQLRGEDASLRSKGDGNAADAEEANLSPPEFRTVLSLLRRITTAGEWPETSAARSRVIRHAAADLAAPKASSGSFTVVNEALVSEAIRNYTASAAAGGSKKFTAPRIPLGNKLFPYLTESIFALEKALAPDRPPSTHVAVNSRAQFLPHVDSGRGRGQSLSMIVGLGRYVGGKLVVEGKSNDIRYKPVEFDGWRERHWTELFMGERFSLVWFTPAGYLPGDEEGRSETKKSAFPNISKNDRLSEQSGDSNIMPSEEQRAAHLAAAAPVVEMVASSDKKRLSALQYRQGTTDVLVINEVLGKQTYALEGDPGWSTLMAKSDIAAEYHHISFSPHGHTVLDAGAHIGCFTRYALAQGAYAIDAFEPESSNFDLLCRNVGAASRVEPKRVAIFHSPAPTQKRFVRGKDRGDGLVNTWRHALADYSHYKDISSAEQINANEGEKYEGEEKNQEHSNSLSDSATVSTMPFFGDMGVLCASDRKYTFVKLDIEGAEVDILCSPKAMEPASWCSVERVIFEWSFTKVPELETFRKAVKNLESAGFYVTFEGKGSWWDSAEIEKWPYHTDLLVFAARRPYISNRRLCE